MDSFLNSSLHRSFVSTTFIGRAPQLAALDAWLSQVEQGIGQVVLVSGEAGIGKTRFINEARRRATERGWQSTQGRCFEPDILFPYAPLIDLLRSCLVNLRTAERRALCEPFAPQLVKLLPELSTTFPDMAPAAQLEPEAEKRRLFETFVHFFTTLMHKGPDGSGTANAPRHLLLILEDLQWSDDTSLELLRYLAHRLRSQPLLLLLNYRSDEIHPSLQHFLADLSREQRPAEVVLPRFTRAEVDAQLRAIFALERPVRAEFLDALLSLTAGNPFFIEEVLKALVATGDLFYRDNVWDRKPIEELHIPHSVQDAVQRRVAQLSEPARHTLTMAAVAGQQFDFQVLQTITEWPEADLLAQIKEWIAAQLVVEVSAEQFAFRHALTRQAIYSQLLVRERQALHRQIGETLERMEGATGESQRAASWNSLTASLAYHFYEAGAWEQALTYAHRAGEQAQALYTPRAAIKQFTRALQAAQQLAQTATVPDLYRVRGLAYETVGDFDLARADLETALRLARAAADRSREWRALLDLGKLWASRAYDQTGAYFRRALAVARTLNEPEMLARSLNQLGNWHLNHDQTSQALEHHQEALALFRTIGDRYGLAQTFDLLALSHMHHGDCVQGTDDCQRAIALWRALHNRQGLASSLPFLAYLGMNYDDREVIVPVALPTAECLRHSKEALHHARAIGWRAGEAFTLLTVAYSRAAQGQYGFALEQAQRGLELAQEIAHRQWRCLATRYLGFVHLDLLALSEARNLLQQSLALARELDSIYHIRCAIAHLTQIAIQEQEYAQAQEILSVAFSPDLPMQTTPQRHLWRERAELALAQGDAALGLQIAERLFATTANVAARDLGAIPYFAKIRGEALAALQRRQEAETHLLAALDTAREKGTPRLVWRIQVALGKLYRTQGNHVKAEYAFAAARTIIDQIAATLSDPQLRDQFVGQAAASMSPPPPSTPLQAAKQAFGGLTRREREVAALVAEGKSNREIAEILVLGVRTVEGHVGRILSKLECTSRTQIATWVVERGYSDNDQGNEPPRKP